MRSVKFGLWAATALTFGSINALPTAAALQIDAAVPLLGQADVQLAQAAKPAAATPTAKRPSMSRSQRAERDAREREITKRLNEQQLQPR